MSKPPGDRCDRNVGRDQDAGIRMSKLVEATNGYSLVEAKNDIWYDIASGYGFCRSLFY
jgi:hypothetical protein